MSYDPTYEQLGQHFLEMLGRGPCRTLLRVITLPEEERAAFIGRLCQDEPRPPLADVMIDLEDETGELVRWRIAEGLRRVL